MRPFVLSAALLVALGGAASAQVEKKPPTPTAAIAVEEGEMTAGELIGRWARASGRLAVLDPQIQGVRVQFAEAGEIDPATLLRLLDFHDIVVTETGPLINAHHRRNLAQKEGPPWELVTDPAVLGKLNKVVTYVAQIKHGAGQQIFATVRGLLTRDTNRIGNILFVQGPDVIIVVDLADKVDYYRRVIQQLDLPPTQRQVEVTLVEMPRPEWRALRKAKQGAALHDAIDEAVDGGRASLLDETALRSVGGLFRMTRQLSTGQGGRIDVNLRTWTPTTKEGVPLLGGDRVELKIDLHIVADGHTHHRSLDLPIPRSLEAGDAHLATFTGREGTTIVVSLRVS